MKLYLLLTSLLSIYAVSGMEEQPPQHRSNPLAQWRAQQQRQDSSDLQDQDIPLGTYSSGGLLGKPGFVTIDLSDDDLAEKPTVEQWKDQLKTSIKHAKTAELIQLLSPDGQPAPTKGFHFVPYQDALAQITAHKNKEVRILTNKAEPHAKCCTCCNPTYLWNRWAAPGILVGAKLAQIGFAAWAIYGAVDSITTTPQPILDCVNNSATTSDAKVECIINAINTQPTSLEIATNAAPAIGALLAALCDLPFSVINAYHRRILKKQQSKYEYYLLSEHTVKTQTQIEAMVRETQGDVKELLSRRNNHDDEPDDQFTIRGFSHTTVEEPHDNNSSAPVEDNPDHAQMDAQFSKAVDVTQLGKKK